MIHFILSMITYNICVFMLHSCNGMTDIIIYIGSVTFCFILWNTETCGCQDHCTEYHKHAKCDVHSQMFWIMCIYFMCISSPSFVCVILRIQFSLICNCIFSTVVCSVWKLLSDYIDKWDVKNTYCFTMYCVFFIQISRMPGLGVRPNIYDMDIDADTGEIHGLF